MLYPREKLPKGFLQDIKMLVPRWSELFKYAKRHTHEFVLLLQKYGVEVQEKKD